MADESSADFYAVALQLRRKLRYVQVKIDAIGIRDASGKVLHRVFERDGDARRIRRRRRTDRFYRWDSVRFPRRLFFRFVILGRFFSCRSHRFLFFRRRSLCAHGRLRLRRAVILQKRKFRQRFLRFALVRRARKTLQKILIRFHRGSRVAQIVLLQFRGAQQNILRKFALRIFAQQKLVRLHRRLVIHAAKSVAHFGVQLADGEQRILHVRGVRRNPINFFVARDSVPIFRERALFRGFCSERGALLLRPGKLRFGGLPFYGGGRFSVGFRGGKRNRQQGERER